MFEMIYYQGNLYKTESMIGHPIIYTLIFTILFFVKNVFNYKSNDILQRVTELQIIYLHTNLK